MLYCFGQFLKGNQEDIRGTIMSLICSDIVNKWENFSMDDADMLGQEWFISFKNHAENLAEQFGDEEMKEKYPASWLLLNL